MVSSMKCSIDCLMVEVTRRCNLECKHCLRGEAEDSSIPRITISHMLKDVTSINCITFTGGEPSLNVPAIKTILEVCKRNKINVGNFYCVSNGKNPSLHLALTLLRWYEYCTDNEISQLVISKDQYHDCDYRRAEKLYSGLVFYDAKERKRDIYNVIDEGNAFRNNLGTRSARIDTWDVQIDNDDEIRIAPDVYVNVFGDVLSSCDLSYTSQKNHILGNVLTNTIPEIVVGGGLKNENRSLSRFRERHF